VGASDQLKLCRKIAKRVVDSKLTAVNSPKVGFLELMCESQQERSLSAADVEHGAALVLIQQIINHWGFHAAERFRLFAQHPVKDCWREH
jgi:hypothetical protein